MLTIHYNITFSHLFQDCLFDGVISPEVDAVYANSAICGTLAASYPPPRVTIRSVSPLCVTENIIVLQNTRYCVFDHCQSFGTATFSRAAGSVSSSYFTSCGR